MQILSIGSDASQLDAIPYLNAARGGGSEAVVLPVLEGTVDALPDGVDALVVASDLQGVELTHRPDDRRRLLGEVVADRLAELAAEGRLPPVERIGVILAGDLFAHAARRGGLGDVRAVWRAFGQRFRWVAGVAGNHDHFGDPWKPASFGSEDRIHVLDEDAVQLDGLVVAGVAGIIGDPKRPFRRLEDDFLLAIVNVIDVEPDLLVLHEGPDVPRTYPERVGNAQVRAAVDGRPGLLVVCGHRYWPEPLARIPGGPQVLNVDHRVVVLFPSGRG